MDSDEELFENLYQAVSAPSAHTRANSDDDDDDDDEELFAEIEAAVSGPTNLDELDGVFAELEDAIVRPSSKKKRRKACPVSSHTAPCSQSRIGSSNQVIDHTELIYNGTSHDMAGYGMVGDNDDVNFLSELEKELMDIPETSSSRSRRPTFIEASQAEWDEVRERLDSLYGLGMDILTKYPNLVHRPDHYKHYCLHCGEQDRIVLCDQSIYVINVGPMLTSVALCEACGKRDDSVQLMKYGLFPVSTKQHVYLQFETLDLLSVMANFNPLLSYVTVVNALNFNSKKRRMAYKLRPEVFNAVMREWKRLEEAALQQNHDLLRCPACADEPHAIHMDGNSKLYRYSKAGGVTKMEYKSPLILDSEDVQREVTKIREKDTVPEVEPVCGDTALKSCKVGGRPHQSKDETGLMLATCRHVFILKALDMYRGEIYEYPYILQKQFPSAKYIAYDTICRYWPWLQKLDGLMAERQTPFLSVMHAKSHVWTCQVKWGAKVVVGTGRSTGETTEQANSFLSRLGPVTRNSHTAVRRERITQSSVFWNVRKLLDLPVWIYKALRKMFKEIEELELLLNTTCEKIGKDENYLSQLANKYSDIGQGEGTKTEKNIEILSCRYRRLAPKVHTDADSSKSRSKVRTRLSKLNEQLTSEIEKYIKESPVKISKAKLLRCRETLKFPWNKGNDCLDVSPDTLAAVEVWQLLQRNREELEILKTERENLIAYATEASKKGCESWITDELIASIKSHLIRGHEQVTSTHSNEYNGFCDDEFEEPKEESDVEGDDEDDDGNIA